MVALTISDEFMLEKHMHSLPERVVQDFDDFLVDEGILVGGGDTIVRVVSGEREGLRSSLARHSQRPQDVGIALGGTESHHDVVRPRDRRQTVLKCMREIDGRLLTFGRGQYTAATC